MTFKPFADDVSSLSIGELSIENGLDRLVISGNVELTRDKAGLAHARTLRGILDAAISALEAERNLPDAVAPVLAEAPQVVNNPFGGGEDVPQV